MLPHTESDSNLTRFALYHENDKFIIRCASTIILMVQLSLDGSLLKDGDPG